MNISHWEQYLTPLGKTKLNIKPDCFVNVFKWNSIILPVFQRKYCWTEKQLKRYWYDLLYVALNISNLGHRKHRRRHDNAHSLGKIVTFEESERITVIDGQQRLTTTLIIISSIRHYLLKLNKNNKHFQHLINTINNILFIKKAPNNIVYAEGDSLQKFVRFLPTYLDRSYFYNVLFDRVPIANNEIANNHIYSAKTFFDQQLRLKEYKCNEFINIKLLCSHLLTQFKFVYIGIPKIEKISASHSIYQWFFERELFVEHSGGDRRGYSQTVCDLFRNYLLSFFIGESLEKQKQIYKLWIEVEKSYENISEFNKYLISLIQTKSINADKPYNVYRDLVKFIEGKFKKYKQDEYKIFMEQLLINLKCKNENTQNKNEFLIYGYFRCTKSSKHLSNEIIQTILKYISRNLIDSINISNENISKLVKREYVFKCIDFNNNILVCMDDDFEDIMLKLDGLNLNEIKILNDVIQKGEKQKQDVKIVVVETYTKNNKLQRKLSYAKI